MNLIYTNPKLLTFTAVVTLMVLFALPALGAVNPEANQVEYWCNGPDGEKFEPVDTPFIVPAPPEGTTWTLLVLKAGTTNETIANPVEGQSYAHSLHDNSHVILCWEPLVITTTSLTSTSTTSSTTSTSTTSSTTTTAPTTTSSSTTTTTPETTTTTTSGTTSTSEATSTTSTVPQSTTTTDPATTTTGPSPTTTSPTLPNTGADDLGPLALVALVLVLLGSLSLLSLRAIGYGHDDR